MPTDVTVQPVGSQEWRDLVPAFRDYNYRHVWGFAAGCAARFRGTVEQVAITQKDSVAGLASVRVKRLAGLPVGLAYVNGGPLVRRDEVTDAERLRLCLAALVDEYVRRQGLVLRILPALGSEDWNQVQASAFEDLRFSLSEGGSKYRTFLLDVDRPLDVIRKGFAQKWRNCLNSAEKQSCTVRTSTDPNFFDEFCRVFDQMIQRKQFAVDLDPPFYARVQRQVEHRERFQVTLVDQGGRVVAGHVSSTLGDTCVYLLGASTDEGLRSKASYLLQWHVIQLAQQRGCRWYDLGGIDPEANPGVYHFKSGLGGDDVTAPGPFELAPSQFTRAVVVLGEKAVRLWRRTRNK